MSVTSRRTTRASKKRVRATAETFVSRVLVCEDCERTEQWPMPASWSIGRATCGCGGSMHELDAGATSADAYDAL